MDHEREGEQEKMGNKRSRKRGKRRMNATAGTRLVEKMGVIMALNEGMVTASLYEA